MISITTKYWLPFRTGLLALEFSVNLGVEMRTYWPVKLILCSMRWNPRVVYHLISYHELSSSVVTGNLTIQYVLY